jgi:hypothetical protein
MFSKSSKKSKKRENFPVSSKLSTQNTPTIKVQMKSDLQEFVESTTKRLSHLKECAVNTDTDFYATKTDILKLKSDLDRFINKLIGLELQITKQAEILQQQRSQCIPPTFDILHECKKCNDVIPSRKRNVVVHGLLHPLHETKLEPEMKHFFKSCLDIDIEPCKVVPIGTAKKAYLVKLQSYRDKKLLFRNCHKFKTYHGRISISDDLTVEERVRKKSLMPWWLEAKQKGHKAYFKGGELFVDGHLFIPSSADIPLADGPLPTDVTAGKNPTLLTSILDSSEFLNKFEAVLANAINKF